MTNQPIQYPRPAVVAKTDLQSISKFGFLSSLIAFTAAAGYSVVQVLQAIGLLGHPWDEILIYGFSLCIATPFLLSMLALHSSATGLTMKFWTLGALVFAAVYTTYVSLNYVVQLATVIPFSLQGSLIDQTPHSLFWDVDALGYIFMGFATLVAANAFSKKGFDLWVRRFFHCRTCRAAHCDCLFLPGVLYRPPAAGVSLGSHSSRIPPRPRSIFLEAIAGT